MKKTIWIYLIGGVLLIALIVLVSYSKNGNGDAEGPLKVTGVDHIKGDASASVTIVEYGDFQCPACQAYTSVVRAMAEQFGDQIAIAYRHFPLVSIHPNALPAAYASEAAAQQGKFWEMHDQIFEAQTEWANVQDPQAYFEQYARNIGLNMEQFRIAYDSEDVRERVKRDRDSGNASDVNSTPSFFLNGERIRPASAEQFASLIQAALTNAPVPEISGDDLVSGENVHEHVDFSMYLNGEKIVFSLEKYQSDPNAEETDDDHDHGEVGHTHDPYVHLHDGNGKIIHKHKTGVTLRYFFQTLGMDFDKDCFTLDTGETFCNNDTHSLKFFVNGVRNQQAGAYEFADGDQLLISYGPLADEHLQNQLQRVSDEACIYSETCPERGSPPTEACVGGLGTDCEG